jgi:hypothetical protein
MSEAHAEPVAHLTLRDRARCFTTLNTPWPAPPLSVTHLSASSDWNRRRYNPVSRSIAVRLSGKPLVAGAPSARLSAPVGTYRECTLRVANS